MGYYLMLQRNDLSNLKGHEETLNHKSYILSDFNYDFPEKAKPWGQ